MEVEFVLRPDDIMAFYEYAWDHPTKRMKGVSLSLWLFLALFGLLSLLTVPSLIQGDQSDAVIVPLILFVALLIGKVFKRPLSRWVVRRGLDRTADQNTKELGWKRVALTPEAIIDASEKITHTIAWAGVEKIVIAGERALIFNSPTSACIVPQRAFADEGAFREFVATARAYRDMASETPSEEKRARRQPADPDTNITADERAHR